MVAPYSGAMCFCSAVGQAEAGSTQAVKFNKLADNWARSISVMRRVRSVAVAPSGSSPVRWTPMTSGVLK